MPVPPPAFPCSRTDWLADLRTEGDPQPLKAIDSHDGVLYLGTCSMVLAPGLRIGWLSVPREVFAPLLQIKRNCDLACSMPAQLVLLDLLRSGELDRQATRMREELERRRECADAVLRRALPAELQPLRPHRGMVCWIELPARISTQRLVDAAAREGIELSPGAPFLPDAEGPSGLRLSYATVPFERLESALETVARLLREQWDPPSAETAPALV